MTCPRSPFQFPQIFPKDLQIRKVSFAALPRLMSIGSQSPASRTCPFTTHFDVCLDALAAGQFMASSKFIGSCGGLDLNSRDAALIDLIEGEWLSKMSIRP